MSGVSLEERRRRESVKHEIALMKLEEAQVSQTLKILESVPTWARDEDEDDWVVPGSGKEGTYNTQEQQSIRAEARKLQHTPIGRCILGTMQDFIIGKSAEISAADENQAAQDYWNGWANRNGWDLKSKEIIRRTIRDGEVFIRWFPPKGAEGDVLMRFMDPAQIQAGTGGKPVEGIETDPDDYEKVLSYHREWVGAGGVKNNEDIAADQVDHWKILVDSDTKRGVSFFHGLGEWIREAEKWLKDRAMLNKIRHIWNVVGEPVSGLTGLSTLKDKFEDATADPPVGGTRKKKVPRPGSVLFTKGVKWDLKSLNINAGDTKDDGRAIELMIAIGTGFPEYIIRGDASNANYSSSMVSESPFVRSMESWQDFFEKVFKKVYARVVQQGLQIQKVPAQWDKKSKEFDAETGDEKETNEKLDTTTECVVNFATLIHRDIKADSEAIQIHIGEDLCSRRTASEKMGYNWQQEQEQIEREKAKEAKEAKRNAELYGVPIPGQPPAGGNPDENTDQNNEE